VRTAFAACGLAFLSAGAILAIETASDCATPTAGAATSKNAAARFAAILQQWTRQ